MDFRPTAEVRDAFDAVVKVLDAELASSFPALAADCISVLSQCNRTGFDPSGYGQPRWSYRFERRSESVSPLCLVAVEATYEEPILAGEHGKLKSEAIADVFHLGASTSFFRRKQELSLDLSDLSGGRLVTTIREELIRAADPMPSEFRKLLEKCAPAVRGGSSQELRDAVL